MVLLWVMLPYITFLNLLIFGDCIFDSISVFFTIYLYSGLYIVLIYFLFGLAATLIQKRFSEPGEMLRRMAIILPMLYVMNVLSVTGIFYLYRNVVIVPCVVKTGMQVWTVIYSCLMSTVITFINEGVANWEAWKASLMETEILKDIYQKSKLLGLKGQINPHFLFNCFNTLSGLIQEDEYKAERFLDEMTKVHRYLLNSDDEMLVSLEKEMKFANSYLYLARERFGAAIQTSEDINPDDLARELPPLSMQVILENIFYRNALSKTDPLTIHIRSAGDNRLSVSHSIHRKNMPAEGSDAGLENLMNKYKMLNFGPLVIQETADERILQIPLIEHKEGIV